jgi:YbbR domain-containing protein
MQKTVPVHVRFLSSLPGGAVMNGFQVDPPTKEIFGPASQVERVTAVETDSIDLSSINPANLQIKVAVFVPEPKVRFLKDPQVTVKINLP